MMASTLTQRWSLGRLLSLSVVVVFAVLATPGASWSPAHRGGRLVRSSAATESILFGQPQQPLPHRRRASSHLFSAEKEESGETEATPSSSSSEVEKSSSQDEEEEEKFGVLKTILLAGPLFIKFTIVLL